MLGRNLVVSLFVATAFGSQAMRAAEAEMLVVESNVPDIQIGTHLPDKPAPSLPPGGRVKVLLSSNETKVFERKGEAKARGTDAPYGGMRTPR